MMGAYLLVTGHRLMNKQMDNLNDVDIQYSIRKYCMLRK